MAYPTYLDFVRVALNLEAVRVRKILDQVEAFRIALGAAEVPDEWIDLLELSREDASRWRRNELIASLRRP